MLSLALRAARRRLIADLRQDPSAAPQRAARQRLLLDLGPWPAWLNEEAVDEAGENHIDQREHRQRAMEARAWLVKSGLEQAAQDIIQSIRSPLAWRLSSDSPDGMVFRQMTADVLAKSHPIQIVGGSWTPIQLPFVPPSEASVSDIGATPIYYRGQAHTLLDTLLLLEEAGQAYTLRDELMLAARGSAIAPDARTRDFGALEDWAGWVMETEMVMVPGSWLEGIRTIPITRLLATHGDGNVATNMRQTLTWVDAAWRDLEDIDGEQRITVWADGGESVAMTRDRDGRMLGDDPETPWAHMILRGALAHALMGGGALIVERRGGLSIDGHGARETFAARLEEGKTIWFDAKTCRAVFSHDFATGLHLPHDPGRVFRDGPRSTE